MWDIVAKIVIAVVSMAISYYTAKKSRAGATQSPAKFDDFDFPQFDEGTPITHVFGDVWTEDWMVLGVGNYGFAQFKVKA